MEHPGCLYYNITEGIALHTGYGVFLSKEFEKKRFCILSNILDNPTKIHMVNSCVVSINCSLLMCSYSKMRAPISGKKCNVRIFSKSCSIPKYSEGQWIRFRVAKNKAAIYDNFDFALKFPVLSISLIF